MVVIDASELKDLVRRLKDVEDKKVKARLRKVLKESAKPAVDAVQEKVREGGPSNSGGTGRITHIRKATQTHKSTRLVVGEGKVTTTEKRTVYKRVRMGSREAIARGVRASLQQTASGATVKIVASPRFLRSHAGFLKAYNLRKFRHPTFGDRDNWHDQEGNPYFNAALYPQRDDIVRRLAAAMDQIAKELGK